MGSSKIPYAVAIFLSSFLLFLAEPMAGKRLLPLLGGSAAVWTTCLVFFQTALLLGYLVAHWLVTRLRPPAQALVYLLLLAACGAQLVAVPVLHADTNRPIFSVLWLLTLLIGLPFLALSATGPLLQAWYANRILLGQAAVETGARPYRLFALSNMGSLLALVIYPWLVEPHFSLRTQRAAWAAGFLLLAINCLWIVQAHRKAAVAGPVSPTPEAGAKPQWHARLLWIMLPACGSLLLSAMTNHLSQNVAAIPLLWVLPLITYLLTFILAFNGGRWHPRWLVLWLVPVALGTVGYFLYDPEHRISLKPSIVVFCAALFILCLFCHMELYRLRPAATHMTAFYLCLAAGGALGAMFVGIGAPLFFSGNYELACGLIFTALLAFVVTFSGLRSLIARLLVRLFWIAASVAMALVLRYQLYNDHVDTVAQVRSFYGTLSVSQAIDSTDGSLTRTLYHGTIEHGTQVFSPELRAKPTSYYAHDSGVGLALDLCCGSQPRRVGMIGLGTGTLAAYGRRDDLFRFYEINPQVEPIARHLFAYVRESRAEVEIVHGDARLSLAAEAPQQYDVLVVDAFSGDAIPVHLLTSQSLELYRRHLRPGGIMAFHVSNQFLDLAPEVKQQADHAGLQSVLITSPENDEIAEDSADWVLVTGNAEFLARPELKQWQSEIHAVSGLRLWTDDYNSLLPLLKNKEPGKGQ
jgi:spermidine synthase